MKLLFDENLSRRLCPLLSDLWPGSDQVVRLGLDHASDEAIWAFARTGGFTIVTLDVDFADMAAFRGAPPQVIGSDAATNRHVRSRVSSGIMQV